MIYFHNMVITFTRNAFDAPEISADLFVYICDVTFEIRACTGGWSVTSSGHEGTPAWTKAKSSPGRRSHRKTYRPAEARIYHSCVELAIFIRKGSVHLKFSFETHRMINYVVATESRWRRSGAVRFHTPSLPQKMARAFSRPGVEATAILATKITWWHGNGDCGDLLSIQTLNCF